MATLTAARAASTFPVSAPVGGGVLCVAYGSYTLAANPTAADIIEFCRVPAGATVIGGYLQGADIDTGTEELDIDVGWAANGTESADPDGFGNFGVITGDVSVHMAVAGIYLPLQGVLITTGPQTFTKETVIQGVVNVDAATGGTGILTLVVFYVMP
jgi:hypothetical protein